MTSQENQSASPNSGSRISPLDNPSPLVSGEKTIRTETGIVSQTIDSDEVSKETEVRLKFAEDLHQYVREYIRIADQKAAFFFTVASALIAFINSKNKVTAWLIPPCEWRWIELFSFLSMIFLLASIFACLCVVVPRLSGAAKGIIFFNSVASYPTQSDYVTNVLSFSSTSLCEEKLKHVYEISMVCRRKYQALFYAIWFGAIGIASTAFLILSL